MYETDNPDEFMQHMEDLLALGGGDEPEMCLSAVLVNRKDNTQGKLGEVDCACTIFMTRHVAAKFLLCVCVFLF